MSRCTTQPFRAVCTLQDGRINSADGLIFFDSILYHAWFLKYAPQVIDGIHTDDHPAHFGLPLRQLPGNRYAASCGFYTQYDETVEYWVKRPDFIAHSDYFDPGRAAKVDVGAGGERAYRTPNIIRLVGDIEFYGYGTIDKIKNLLSRIPALGKKPAAGWGAIKSWKVEPVDEDWSTYSPKYGLMRPMPISEYNGEDKDRYSIRDCAIRPPSWKIINQCTCYVPEVIRYAGKMDKH